LAASGELDELRPLADAGRATAHALDVRLREYERVGVAVVGELARAVA
jgi:hypothetical protein